MPHCTNCGNILSESANSYTRTIEDVVDGRWCSTQWTILRRYCKNCKSQQSAHVPEVLSNEHYGNNIMAMVVVLRNMSISFEKIRLIISMMYGKHIPDSTLVKMCHKVSDMCRPLYDSLLEDLIKAGVIYGDETGWHLDEKRFWVWVFASQYIRLFHIAPTRSKLVAEAILGEFDGITNSDSYPGGNDLGKEQQRCLLHYHRDMYRTKDGTDSDEFKKLFEELHNIFKSAQDAWDEKDISSELIDSLQNRIDTLAEQQYSDKDCKRYAKRLKRERNQLLTFLRHPNVEYHNNTSERALRGVALMRKILYGNISKRDLETTETLATIYAACNVRRINPYRFFKDFLDGKVTDIPMPVACLPVCVKPQLPVLAAAA